MLMRLVAILCLVSCSTDFEVAPVKRTSIEFNFRVSENFPGLVKFSNGSRCLERYLWEFDFLKDGQQFMSKATAPTVYFPSNGTYNVKLTGWDKQDKEFVQVKQLTISNY